MSRWRVLLFAVVAMLIGSMLIAVGVLGHVAFEQLTGARGTIAARQDAVKPVDSALVGEVIGILKRDFVDSDKINADAMLDGAIEGVFKQLNDPHSTYISPHDYALSKGDFSGTFQGIGATVQQVGDYVVVQRPLPGTPAEKAGLKSGDQLLAVDGEDAKGWSVQKAVTRIRGPRGTAVQLKIRHPNGKEETYKIVRDEVLVASVDGSTVIKDASGADVTDLGYIRIRMFTARSPKELQDAVQQATSRGVKGLILDLRQNPGGLLKETTEIADFFLDRGTIVSQVDRDGKRQSASATPGQITNLPIVIVQDEASASGSEVLAAALEQNGRAVVVGTRSFGKGTVNHLRDLSNGGAVYVSIARWLTPNGDQIEARGVTPDYPVTPTAEDLEARRDVTVFRAIDLLRSGQAVPKTASR